MDDKTLVERAVAVPLLERLRRVPPDARLEYEHDPCHHSLFPIGAMCHEAATRIEALEAALRKIEGQAVCVAMPATEDEMRDWLQNILQTTQQALESQP